LTGTGALSTVSQPLRRRGAEVFYRHRLLSTPAPGDIRGKEVFVKMSFLSGLISSFKKEEGQGLAEYALILALIAIVAIIALIFLGNQVSQILSNVGNSV